MDFKIRAEDSLDSQGLFNYIMVVVLRRSVIILLFFSIFLEFQQNI